MFSYHITTDDLIFLEVSERWDSSCGAQLLQRLVWASHLRELSNGLYHLFLCCFSPPRTCVRWDWDNNYMSVSDCSEPSSMEHSEKRRFLKKIFVWKKKRRKYEQETAEWGEAQKRKQREDERNSLNLGNARILSPIYVSFSL